ncbi:hypothetical protein ACFV9E_44160 [Streptomyces sp. NPDC059835]|uniref:hypothetical protein n=1 Tax=Streptomyces sp. NPDC059835 TaxID=3346967 RepID=UPI003653E2AC
MRASVPGVPVFLAPPYAGPSDARPVGAGAVRVVWALRDGGRDLDANLVRLGAGALIGEHTETVLGVLLVVVAGSGELRTPDRTVPLAPGSVAWLPAGTDRAVHAGTEGLTYTTAHRRRPPLNITPEPRSDAGEPACLLNLVCDACGRLAAERDARYCARCGTRLPAP